MRKGYRLASGVCWESGGAMGTRMSSRETGHTMIQCDAHDKKPCRVCGHAFADHCDMHSSAGTTIHELCTAVLNGAVGPARVCGCAEFRPVWEEYEVADPLDEIRAVLDTIEAEHAEPQSRGSLAAKNTRALMQIRGIVGHAG